MQGRGVMLDLYRHFGRERKFVGYDDLMRCLEANDVTVEPGDMLCLYTGFGDLVVEMGGDPDEHTLRRFRSGPRVLSIRPESERRRRSRDPHLGRRVRKRRPQLPGKRLSRTIGLQVSRCAAFVPAPCRSLSRYR